MKVRLEDEFALAKFNIDAKRHFLVSVSIVILGLIGWKHGKAGTVGWRF